jgi:hypothetical protein
MDIEVYPSIILRNDRKDEFDNFIEYGKNQIQDLY